MNFENVKAFLMQAKEDPSAVEVDRDEIDQLLLGVIKIEKKHLYGLESTSTAKRQEDIRKFLDENMRTVLGEQGAS